VLSDLDIYRAAKVLIDHHGNDAPIYAAMRADELLVAGDVEGQRTWLRIVKAVEALVDIEKPKNSSVH